MRTSGTWTSYLGDAREVAGRHDGDLVALRDPHNPRRIAETVPATALGDIVSVVLTATWRGGRVVVSRRRSPHEVIFRTDDPQLAQREGLDGDWQGGWGGLARVDELEDLHEQVRTLRAGGEGAR